MSSAPTVPARAPDGDGDGGALAGAGAASLGARLRARLARALAAPAFLAFAACALLGLSVGLDIPWTDDARFYVPAAEAYGGWIEHAVAGPLTLDVSAWSRPGIDRAFANNREHPPVAKYVMAAGWLLLHHWTGLLDDITACRVPIVLLWAWMCALVFAMLRARVATVSAVVGTLVLVCMPRVFFDGHAETLDLAVAAFIVGAAAALLSYLERPTWRRGLFAFLCFTLALGTKLNAPFALAGMIVFVIVLRPPRVEGGTMLRLAPLPWPLVAMVVLSPLVVVLLWPWMWFDTAARLEAYVRFHLQHYGILFYYGGHIYKDDVAPWSAPWVMAAMTLPLPVLVVALFGTLRALADTFRRLPRRGGAVPATPATQAITAARPPAASLGLLALLEAGVQLGAVSLPGVPTYGGVKLFLPAFPFIAILAALGFDDAARAIPPALARLRATASRLRRDRLAQALATSAGERVALAALAALLILPGALGLVAYRGKWLSYYAEWVGGVRGAAIEGFETQYYDLAYPELAAALVAALPNGGRVAILPNPKEYAPYVRWWQERGALPRGITLVAPEQAELLVLTHERRWPQYPEMMARYRTGKLLSRTSIAGVPLFSVYDLRSSR